jgi:hypothetical protein
MLAGGDAKVERLQRRGAAGTGRRMPRGERLQLEIHRGRLRRCE